MMMGQCWLGKVSPNKPSDRLELLSKVAMELKIFSMKFSAD